MAIRISAFWSASHASRCLASVPRTPHCQLKTAQLSTTTRIAGTRARHFAYRRGYSTQSPWSSQTGSRPETSSSPKRYSFEDIEARLDSPSQPADSPASKPLTIIDVREPSELAATGRIPGAHNIPISSAPDGLFLQSEEFEAKWGFEKPQEGDEVVFYCKAGVRSRAAAGMVSATPGGGWEGVRIGEFPGSWVEWESKGGKIER